jgi:hypothetical protein
MNEVIIIQWLQRNWPIWGAFLLGFIPTLIAEVKGRPKTRWYLYGAACALVAWPLVTLPTIHALFLRQRNGMSEEVSRQRRRADALALLVRGPANSSSDHAVSYYHRAVHLGYVPKQHHWIADALDDGLRLAVIVENVKPGWFFRWRVKYVGTRIIVLYDGR